MPARKFGSPVNVSWPYWLSAMISFDWNGCSHTPTRHCCRPFVSDHVVGEREEVAIDVQVAAVVAAGEPELRLRVGRLAAADDDRANGQPGEKPWHRCGRRAWGRLAGEEVGGAREAESRRVQQIRREHVRVLDAEHLFAQAEQIGAVRIERRRRIRVAVVDRVDGAQRAAVREDADRVGQCRSARESSGAGCSRPGRRRRRWRSP